METNKKIIKVFKASSFKYTPFDNFSPGDLDYLQRRNIQIVDSSKLADIIISQNYKHLKKHFWKFILGKKFLIWTLESRFDTNFVSRKKVLAGLADCHIMNVYTRDVFVSNVTMHAGLINKKLVHLPQDFQLESRKIITLMSYYKGINAPKLIRFNENIDLIALRSTIALEGDRKGVIDVYGKGWPKGVAKENSRDGDWTTRKKELLKPYNFNLSFENTAAYNYMTEKIWDSIENYCLPIYYGKNTNAYEIFPKGSFIDYSEFKNPEELFDFIKDMDSSTFVNRLNKCIDVYNSISSKGEKFVIDSRNEALDKIVEKIESIVL